MVWTVKNKLIFLLASIGVTTSVILFFKYIFFLVAPFVLGFFLARILERPVKWLSKKLGGRQTLASAIITTILSVAIIAILALIIIKVCEELQNLLVHFDYYKTMFFCKMDGICCCFDEWFGMEKGRSIGILNQNVDNFFYKIQGDMVTSVINVSIPVISVAIGIFAGAAILFISTIFLGKDLDNIREWKDNNIFTKEVTIVWNCLKKLGNVYFKVQGIIILINSAICAVGLLLINNPYWLMLGIIIGVLDALPVFGTGTVFIPWGILCMISGEMGKAAVLYSIYLITYFLREILESKMMGSKLGVAGLTMLFAIYEGVLLYGFWGFILGPISYCIIKELILYLKNLLECGKVNSN